MSDEFDTELDLDEAELEAASERNNKKIDEQEVHDADNDCGDACKI